MKHLILLLFIITYSSYSYAQYPGNANDWVEYDKTYYRFSITEDGIYKLMKSDLLAAGMAESDIVGSDFKMIRNGQEVPLYVSTNGSFGNNDFIEFLGKRNDGEADTNLYSSPLQQPGTLKSLFNDASIHFLTLDTSGGNLRINAVENDLDNLPAKENYYMAETIYNNLDYKAGQFRKITFTGGSLNLYESHYDAVEGYNSVARTNQNTDYVFNTSNVYTNAGTDATVYYKAASITTGSTDFQPGNIEVSLGSSDTETVAIPGNFYYNAFEKSFAASELTNTTFRIWNDGPVHLYIPELLFVYPREFEFANTAFSYVNVEKSGSRYLDLNNLPGNSEVVVYDLSSKERIAESIQANTPIRTTTNSTSNNLVFDVEIATPNFENTVTFENYVGSNENFIVVYHPDMESPVGGENYVDKFIDHKASEIGGSWNMKKVNINQLIDQFAYGVRGHAGAIKNFVLELKENNNLPTHILLMGKGYEYQITLNDEIENDYIPTFGNPASDALLVSDYLSDNQNCSIGRISARNVEELKMYVDKVIEYQTIMAQTDDAYQTKDKLWMKNSMHLGGGQNSYEQSVFKNSLEDYEEVYENPFVGGKVYPFYKQSTEPIDITESASIDSLINSGVSLINYFGHSSVNALEFSISDFSQYDHQGKYPFMITNGCYVGDLFQTRRSLSEDFVLIAERGTLSFMGPTQFGIASGMNRFCDNFYGYFVQDEYGISIGESIQKSQADISNSSLYNRLTKQQMVFHGDPSLSIYVHEKPDYLISAEDLIFEPNNITANVEEFKVKVVVSNIGKSLDEPVDVQLTRTLPNGQTEVQTQSFAHLYYQDTLVFDFQTNILEAGGVNQFNVMIDPETKLDEITRANNNLGNPITRAIIENSVTPLFPSKFGITNQTENELIAYASQFTATPRNFEIQIDTTELFNSSLLQSSTVASYGGTIKWTPNINYTNEEVYYWRVKANEDDAIWTNSSFVYLNDHETGWNQSHYYQYLYDDFSQIRLEEDRLFHFGINERDINVRTAMFPTIPHSQTGYSLDGAKLDWKRCTNYNFAVAIFDEKTGIPYENYRVNGSYGRFRSRYCSANNKYAFYYSVKTPELRKDFMDMLDGIEEDKYVLIYSIGELKPNVYDWASDEATYGYTIYDKLSENGAELASQIAESAPYVYYFQKGNENFEHSGEFVKQNFEDIIDENFIMPTLMSQGEITSTIIGPAESWGEYQWSWNHSLDEITEGDQINYTIIGIRQDDSQSILFENRSNAVLDISNIDASEYPYLKIKIKFEDAVHQSPPQIDYFRVVYEPLPELAINITDIAIGSPHKYIQNEPISLTYKLENIYRKDMSPVLVHYTYSQALGGQTLVEDRYEALPAGESQTIEFNLNTSDNNLVGKNLLFIDANPDDDQPEQYHFNNVALLEYEIIGDNENPYLDVTFDGIHIINGDLVAKTPEILITLTDENENLALDDPDDFEIYLQHPDRDTLSMYTANSPEINFFPADSSNLEEENKATIEFSPTLTPGTYEMRVQAMDRSNNEAGDNDYLVTFEVIDEDVITQIINYPNPFTTYTEFIAKIVGEAPDEVLIQVFTQNGKVIRELHTYGTDIELSQGNGYYKVAHWDGTDEFGDPVGNGVYFYKITMKRGGEMIEAYDADRYSEYYHNGIGKLYIMR